MMNARSMHEDPNRPDATEDDQIVDHTIALALNTLVNEHHLTPSQVSQMNDEMLEAFLARFNMNVLNNKFDERQGRKAARIFSGEHRSASETLNTREHTIEMMRNTLREVQKELPGVAGFILYGSSMLPNSDGGSQVQSIVDAHEGPRDIDIYPIFKDGVDEVKTNAALLRVGAEVKKRLYPDDSHVIESVGFHSVGEFARRISQENAKGIPIWAWRPDVIMFVGELECDPPIIGPDGERYSSLNEEQTNALMQYYLHGENMRGLKREKMDKIRGLLREGRY